MTHLLNFITFQIWAMSVLVGAIVSVAAGDTSMMWVAPWIGLIVGVAANEMLPGFVNEGIRIVPENNGRTH